MDKLMILRKIKKYSSVDDFVSGVVEKQISDFPEEENLTEEQKRTISNLSYSKRLYLKDSLFYYLKYPNYFYLSLYGIDEYYGYSGEDDLLKRSFDLFMKRAKSKTMLPSYLPLSYMKILNDNMLFSETDIIDFLIWHKDKKLSSRNADVFDYFKNIYREEYDKMSGKNLNVFTQDVKQYLQFPSSTNLSKLIASSEPFRENTTDSELKAIIEIRKTVIESVNYFKKTKAQGYYDSEELIDACAKAIAFVESDQNGVIEEKPFFYSKHKSKVFGELVFFSIDGFVSKVDGLYRLSELVNHEDGNRHRYDITVDNDGLYLEEDDTSILIGDRADDGAKSYIRDNNLGYNIDAAFSRMIPLVNSCETLLSYVEDTFKNKSPEVAFLEVSNNSFFRLFMDHVNQDCFSKYVSGYTGLPYGAKNTGFSFHSEIMDYAEKIWTIIPESCMNSIVTSEVNAFYLCSGLFPCRKVLEMALKDLNWSMNLIGCINCSGSREDTEKVISYIKKEHSEKKAISKHDFYEKLPEFLNSKKVIKKGLCDFPQMQEYISEFIRSETKNCEQIYDYNTSSYIDAGEKVLGLVMVVPIYLIDKNYMLSYFDEKVLEYMDISPLLCGGFYSRYFNGGKAIVVYTGGESGNIDKVLGEIIGLSKYNEGDLKVEEESTLWHEMSHALYAELRIGGDYDPKSVYGWMTSPDEILAFSHGNLAFIKNKLRVFFNAELSSNKAIESGFLSEIKMGIIENFPIEFGGMTKDEALSHINKNIPDFDESTLSYLNGMSFEEKLKYLVSLFSRFFMGTFLRDKVTSLNEMILGKNKITFKEDIVVPEPEHYESNQSDELVKELEKDPNYISFIENVQKEIKSGKYGNYYIKNFVHDLKSKALIRPKKFDEVLKMLFDLTSSVMQIDFNRDGVFKHLANAGLINKVKQMALSQQEISRAKMNVPKKPTQISPSDAKEAGEFMADMDEREGRNWFWTAKSRSWYKTSGYEKGGNEYEKK